MRRSATCSSVAARFVPALQLRDEPEAVRRLLALAEAARAKGLPAAGAAPFKGLYPFEEDDAEWFFGPEALIARLAQRAEREPFLAIVGASGSGKSSLLRAGLIPALRQRGWAIHLLMPSAHPLAVLAANVVSAETPGRRTLLVVDQLEELFLDAAQREIARQVFLSLVELAGVPGVGEARRPASLAELLHAVPDAAAAREVLTSLADARLVITSEDAVEVAHEALIREWPRLRDWLEESRERLQLRRRLAQAAAEWAAGNSDRSFLLTGAAGADGGCAGRPRGPAAKAGARSAAAAGGHLPRGGGGGRRAGRVGQRAAALGARQPAQL